MDPARPPPPPSQRPEDIQEASIVPETAAYSTAIHQEESDRPGCVQAVAVGTKAPAHIGIAIHQAAPTGGNHDDPRVQSSYPGVDEQIVSTGEHGEECDEGRVVVGLGSWALQLITWGLLVGTLISLGNFLKIQRENEQKAREDAGRWWVEDEQQDLPVLQLVLFGSSLFWTCFVIYSVMCLDEGARKFVAGLDRKLSVKQHVHQFCKTAPVVRFTTSCYHFDVRTRTTANGGANTSTETCTAVPIVSHTASAEYSSAKWEDATVELPGTSSAMFTKLHLSKEFGFVTDAGKQRLLDAYNSFCAANRRDDFQCCKQDLYIAGFQEVILCARNVNGVPWWVGSCGYWIASILLFNVPYRQFLVWKTETVHHTITKKIA